MLIIPCPGFLYARAILASDIPNEQFTTLTSTPGELKRAKVLAIGLELIDDHGNIRKANCTVGDIIYHAPAANDFLLDNIVYYLIHFSNVRGVYQP
jgi:co-chaperonin GroES (HSP10)